MSTYDSKSLALNCSELSLGHAFLGASGVDIVSSDPSKPVTVNGIIPGAGGGGGTVPDAITCRTILLAATDTPTGSNAQVFISDDSIAFSNNAGMRLVLSHSNTNNYLTLSGTSDSGNSPNFNLERSRRRTARAALQRG